jgi:hypothetical protein
MPSDEGLYVLMPQEESVSFSAGSLALINCGVFVPITPAWQTEQHQRQRAQRTAHKERATRKQTSISLLQKEPLMN